MMQPGPKVKVHPLVQALSSVSIMSLHQKLLSYRGKNTHENVEKLTLDQMANMQVDCKAKMNQTYEKAFQDLEWTQFIVSRYEESGKPEHRRYLQYVKLRLEEANQGQEPVPPKAAIIKKPVKKGPSASRMAKPVTEEEKSDWEQMSLQSQSEIENCMNRMEEALAQAISHLQKVTHQGRLIQPKTSDSAEDRTVESSHLDTLGLTSEEKQSVVAELFAGDVDFEFAPAQENSKTYHQECQRLVAKIRQELQGVQQIIKRKSKKVHLYEVMCSAESELAKQCQNMGKAVRRFGLALLRPILAQRLVVGICLHI